MKLITKIKLTAIQSKWVIQITMSSIGAEQIRLRIFIGIFREKAYRRVSSGGIFIVLVL